MIKGVSRQIIELKDTGSLYYEKAWLVVKPQYASAQESLLLEEARKMLRKADILSSMKPKRQIRQYILPALAASFIGALVSFLVWLIF